MGDSGSSSSCSSACACGSGGDDYILASRIPGKLKHDYLALLHYGFVISTLIDQDGIHTTIIKFTADETSKFLDAVGKFARDCQSEPQPRSIFASYLGKELETLYYSTITTLNRDRHVKIDCRSTWSASKRDDATLAKIDEDYKNMAEKGYAECECKSLSWEQ